MKLNETDETPAGAVWVHTLCRNTMAVSQNCFG